MAFHPLIYITQPEEAVLRNVFLKRLRFSHRIRSTNAATAGAATATAGALPNAPVIHVHRGIVPASSLSLVPTVWQQEVSSARPTGTACCCRSAQEDMQRAVWGLQVHYPLLLHQRA
jgi:hypothetical protein